MQEGISGSYGMKGRIINHAFWFLLDMSAPVLPGVTELQVDGAHHDAHDDVHGKTQPEQAWREDSVS
jgi:hypothetical protein